MTAAIPHLLGKQTVDRFEIKDFLGRGAIGDVLLAWDPEKSRFVALKVVRVSKSDPEMLEAEKNGLILQAQLAEVAPQVAAVYEAGQDGDFFWVAMEYVAGTDLAEILAKGPLPEARAVAITLELVSMLEVCHEFSAEVSGRRIFGIVHGDIKPENIRLQEGDRVRVLDFGIAKHLSQTRRFTVNLFGSLPYTPPERLERGVVDRHSDLWAVGVVLAAMCSGKRPFPGNTPEELEQAIRRGVPPLPLPALCSPGLAHIVSKSLAFEVERRYPSAADLKADLLAVRDSQPLPSLAAAPGGEDPDLHLTRRTARPLPPEEARNVEATRRTDRPPVAAIPVESTRRTGDAGPAASSPMPATAAVSPAVTTSVSPVSPASDLVSAPPRPRHRMQTLVMVLAGLFLIAVGVSQIWAWNQSKQLRSDLTAPHPDLESIAQRYTSTIPWSFFSTDLFGVGKDLLGALTTSAGKIVDSYRGDDPTTTQRGWQTAYRYLHAAAQIAPRDKKIRSRLLYSQGHLDRIESITLKNQGDKKKAAATSQAAAKEFEEAARWDSSWPDPYLGLARIYAYDLFDLDALQRNLNEASRRGYHLGRRETAMLADGFRMQGLGLEARADRAEEGEKDDLLKQARAYLQQSVKYYDQIEDYADSASNREEAQSHLEAVQSQLAPPPEPASTSARSRSGETIHAAGFWQRLGRALEREFVKKPPRRRTG
ncbi:MAG: eukaryotic-like serine/threonine-protein kinase [Acidobacteriota bacterium]|nr:eukaryotic-like serine/threonine-protein kinase [Acidobacteriota bacterium]